MASDNLPDLLDFQAILFDLDNTLIDQTQAMRGFLQALAREHALPPEQLPDFLDTLLRADAMGTSHRLEFCTLISQQLQARASLPASPNARRIWSQLRQQIGDHVQPQPRITALLSTLQTRGVPLALVSNGSGPNQRKKLQNAGLSEFFPPEAIIISGELGVDKPHAQMFLTALAALGSPEPPRCLFLGDNPHQDIQGAHALGFATCWLSHDRPYPDALPPPTFSIRDLLALNTANHDR